MGHGGSAGAGFLAFPWHFLKPYNIGPSIKKSTLWEWCKSRTTIIYHVLTLSVFCQSGGRDKNSLVLRAPSAFSLLGVQDKAPQGQMLSHKSKRPKDSRRPSSTEACPPGLDGVGKGTLVRPHWHIGWNFYRLAPWDGCHIVELPLKAYHR